MEYQVLTGRSKSPWNGIDYSAEFMAKWGIRSDEELGDIVTIQKTVMRSQFQRLRPKWRREFGEEALQAVESAVTYYPSASARPIARVPIAHQD